MRRKTDGDSARIAESIKTLLVNQQTFYREIIGARSQVTEYDLRQIFDDLYSDIALEEKLTVTNASPTLLGCVSNPVDSEDYDRTYTSDEHPSFGGIREILDWVHMHLAGIEVFYIGDPTGTCVNFNIKLISISDGH